MIASMTAFSRTENSDGNGRVIWEIRSVNHRYLDLGIRLPEDVRSLEPAVRERIGARLNRGKVECQLRYEPPDAAGGALALDTELARRVLDAAESLHISGPTVINRLDVLRWPGVVEKPAQDLDAVGESILSVLERGLEALIEARQREGARIRDFILARCSEAGEFLARVRTRLPEITEGIRQRYMQRAQESQVALDPERLEQEMLLLAQKMDVAEELDRLETHIAEVVRVLDDARPVGRRLDFLMQEMNREANTIGSKAAHVDITNVSVDLKVLIEQMREQVQNVE